MPKITIDEPVNVKKDTVVLIFKENRTYSMQIGEDEYIFFGNEPKEVPRKILKHPDFTDEKKSYFITREV